MRSSDWSRGASCSGMPMAYNLHKAFIPVRKSGKLPRATSRIAYDLEYGSAEIEVHREDITPGMRVVIVDDLIATGGTLEAAVHLVEQLGAKVVKIVCLLELKGLHGRRPHDVLPDRGRRILRREINP